MNGQIFCDRAGGVTEIILASASLGIVLWRKNFSQADEILAGLYAVEIFGTFFIMTSKLKWMKVALWIFAFRVAAGLGYMGVIHGDKLARSTIGFAIAVLLYCIVRVRGMKAQPA